MNDRTEQITAEIDELVSSVIAAKEMAGIGVGLMDISQTSAELLIRYGMLRERADAQMTALCREGDRILFERTGIDLDGIPNPLHGYPLL